jgi:hypothetical protein
MGGAAAGTTEGRLRQTHALYAPEVECLAKGKAHKRYEFGVKVSVATTGRHDRGRDDHRGAEFDQERRQGARSGDAPDAQGPAMVFWDEPACGVR